MSRWTGPQWPVAHLLLRYAQIRLYCAVQEGFACSLLEGFPAGLLLSDALS